MRLRAFWLILLRVSLFIFSLAALACHIAQILFLVKYSQDDQHRAGPWWPHYVPYILYFVGPGFSIICSIALIFVSISTIKNIRGDRILSVINLILMIAVVVYNTLQAGVVPWTDGKEKDPGRGPYRGYADYCSFYGSGTDSFYRCWLSNGLWLASIVTAFLWLLLAIYTFVQSSSDIYESDYDGYDYKLDVPMAVTSSPVPPKAEIYRPESPVAMANYPSSKAHEPDYDYYANYAAKDNYYEKNQYPMQPVYTGGYDSPTAPSTPSYYYNNGNSPYYYGGHNREEANYMLPESTSSHPSPLAQPPVANGYSTATAQPPHSYDH
ncbi:uncharacterized protein BYT42DRAFT_572957 [Radiomyces spectabilis]|uniref:uncharacterized protein n=1 Tax=Radiomyces spectabilis TaxID=64574 RepID=UPI00221F3046|nr:uncharacterized protein BYT42DRAFT_572957 [Radiomyces spectabilis]KAI8375974.1 hypothetical protein BYT42DRAFT_572957 [Radiomyces spectabilis]